MFVFCFAMCVFVEQTQVLGEAIPGGIGSRVNFHCAVSLLGDHERIVSRYKTNSSIYILFYVRQLLKYGRVAYSSANTVYL